MLVITVQIVKYMLEEIHPIVIRDMLKENNDAGNYSIGTYFEVTIYIAKPCL